MRILLGNGDGINSDGFSILENIAAALDGEVWCVAPKQDRSGLALRLRQPDPRRFALRGTPADCVIVAIRKLMPGPRN